MPPVRSERGRRPSSTAQDYPASSNRCVPSGAPTAASLGALAFCLLAAFAAAVPALAQPTADLAREKRWADQVVPTLVVGEAVTLTTASGTRFLALDTSVPNARGSVILAHGPGLHPDHGLTGELRVHLADRGYSTLSLQMPVLGAETEAGDDYRALFPDAVSRIAAGIAHAQRADKRPVAIVSHAMGSGMTYAYLRATPAPPVAAWVALSYYGSFEDLSGFRFPIYDLYGASDYWGIRGPSITRAWKLASAPPGSKQLALADGGRFLAGGEKAVLREVAAFLDATMPRSTR